MSADDSNVRILVLYRAAEQAIGRWKGRRVRGN